MRSSSNQPRHREWHRQWARDGFNEVVAWRSIIVIPLTQQGPAKLQVLRGLTERALSDSNARPSDP